MNKILKILMISLLVASTSLLQASSAARTGTFAAGDITTELNSGPIVKSGSTNISYQHDPIAEGKSAFQGDIVDATPSGAKFLYAGGISTCQIIIVRDTKSGKTKFVYADQFFKPQSCAKLLTDFRNDTDSSDSDKTESTLSVRIVVNQKFFNDTSIAGDFSGVYGCSIDGRLEQLSNAFRSSAVNSEIIRLSLQQI